MSSNKPGRAHTLHHDVIDGRDHDEQIAHLLFSAEMADERGADAPRGRGLRNCC
jgi:hypothetical protein